LYGTCSRLSLVGIKIDVRIDVSDVSSTHKTPQNTPKSPIFSHFLVQRLHRGEQQHIPDRLTVGQQHAHSVDAEADAARSWGQRGAFGPSKGRFSGCFSACSLNPLSSVSCSFPPSNRNWFKNGLKWFKLKSSSAGSRKHLNC